MDHRKVLATSELLAAKLRPRLGSNIIIIHQHASPYQTLRSKYNYPTHITTSYNLRLEALLTTTIGFISTCYKPISRRCPHSSSPLRWILTLS